VTVSTVSGTLGHLPKAGSGLTVPPELQAIHDKVQPRLGGPHILTGPVAVRGARAGQVLEVRIKAIELFQDWGYNTIRPLAGALPYDFDTMRMIHIPLDKMRMVGRMPWGLDLELKPFFGIMAVAPPLAWGPVNSPPPRKNGGNLDNKELVAGTTLYLPVFVENALFSVGDGHAAQGNGEVCLTALEASLRADVRLTVLDDAAARDAVGLLRYPFVETDEHWIPMGLHEDLNEAMRDAVRRAITFLETKIGMERHLAYAYLSAAGDFEVSQVVDIVKGVHCRIRKSDFA